MVEPFRRRRRALVGPGLEVLALEDLQCPVLEAFRVTVLLSAHLSAAQHDLDVTLHGVLLKRRMDARAHNTRRACMGRVGGSREGRARSAQLCACTFLSVERTLRGHRCPAPACALYLTRGGGYEPCVHSTRGPGRLLPLTFLPAFCPDNPGRYNASCLDVSRQLTT